MTNLYSTMRVPHALGYVTSVVFKILVLAVLGLWASGLYPSLDATQSAQAASSGSYLLTFSPVNEAKTQVRTAQQAVADAKTFSVIVAPAGTYRQDVGAMYAARPGLLLMVYMSGTFAQANEARAYPESWYARDGNGSKVRSNNFGNYLMDPSSAGWVQNRVNTCRSLISFSGYGGCMLDMLGTAPTQAAYLSAPAINPATKQSWTASDWQRTTTSLAATVRANTSGQLWGNGYGSGTRYFSTRLGESRTLSAGVDGALTEDWVRTANQSMTTFPTEARWKDSLDQLVDLGRTGGRTAVIVKLWGRGTQAQKDAVHRFSLATFLLGTDGRSAFYASYTPGDALTGHRYWTMHVGMPTGSYTTVGGLFQRDFTAGKVLVNPTPSALTVQLGGTYRDLSGTQRTSVTLPAHSGDVFQQ